MRIQRNDVAAPSHVQFGARLTDVPLANGLPSVQDLQEELMEYCDVLLGRADPPVESPYLSLMEIATAYYARGLEIEMMIHDLEQKDIVAKGAPHYRFRTGQLRAFTDLAKRMAELGSRRLTQEALLAEQRFDAGH